MLNLALSVFACLPLQETQPRPILIDRDNLIITESCTLIPAEHPILDSDNNGVLQITGSDISVHFQANPEGAKALHGALFTSVPERYSGIGILITGQNVKLTGAVVSGYRVGIQATKANRLELRNCDVSDNRRDRLRSTPESEALEDWLWPHSNDEGEWAARYGAGIYLKGGEFITVSACRARNGQNGLILERTRAALVSDNDFSFLSGWGVALWRAEQNFITRNALDFCIRGYSHGIYNRGQDSAGILLFEQCSNNVIAENSATHCGDGLFAFAGQEALGQSGPAELDRKRRGNNDNIIARNDFSYAAAHGLELTFSFGNKIFGNRLVGNGICGLWGGYSRETVISKNLFADNGQMGSRGEGGGINMEHAQQNYLLGNEFLRNSVGVRLWWDADPGLAKLPWVQANGFASGDNILVSNRFAESPLGIELIQAGPTTLAGNTHSGVEIEVLADQASEPQRLKSIGLSWDEPEFPIFGDSSPVGAHPEWNGREQILMGEFGPCDLTEAHLWRLPGGGAQHTYRLLGPGKFEDPKVSEGSKLVRDGDTLLVRGRNAGLQPYQLQVTHTDEAGANAQQLTASAVLLQAQWEVRFFAWQSDPRADLEAWQREAQAAPSMQLAKIDFAFNSAGPGDLKLPGTQAQSEALSKLPADRFGTLAQTELEVPQGSWRLNCVADDGVRVWIDGQLVIDAWKHQGATPYHADFEVSAKRMLKLRLEHFELDGAARLSVSLQRSPGGR